MGRVNITRKKTRDTVLELRILNMVGWYRHSEYYTAVSLAERLNDELDSIPTGNDQKARHLYQFVADEMAQTVDLWKLNSYGDRTRLVLHIDFKG